MSLADTYQKCALHPPDRDHALTIEQHHIIPQAWQHFWQPAPAPSPVPTPTPAPASANLEIVGSGALWDPRTIALAPTCHRNVHFWIVAMMHAFHSQTAQGAVGIAAAKTAVIKKYGLSASHPPKEMAVSETGLQRYWSAGGDLHALGDAGEWGEA